jgi:hypothetical protein
MIELFSKAYSYRMITGFHVLTSDYDQSFYWNLLIHLPDTMV